MKINSNFLVCKKLKHIANLLRLFKINQIKSKM